MALLYNDSEGFSYCSPRNDLQLLEDALRMTACSVGTHHQRVSHFLIGLADGGPRLVAGWESLGPHGALPYC
jgi:hypothetical protein